MTIQEASQRLGKSETTIRRWIRSGKLKATMVDGAYNISEEAISDYPNGSQMTNQVVGIDQAVIRELRSENEYLKERIRELEEARERADMIAMQLSRSMEQAQKMLEAHKAEKRDPWWKRILKRKGD